MAGRGCDGGWWWQRRQTERSQRQGKQANRERCSNWGRFSVPLADDDTSRRQVGVDWPGGVVVAAVRWVKEQRKDGGGRVNRGRQRWE